jgi:ribosome-binding factor A
MHLTELLRNMGDQRLATLVLTEVEVTDDLSIARLSVRSLTEEPNPRAHKALVRALGQASGRLRRGLGPRLDLKKIPELRFEYDLGHDNVRRVDELLREIETDGPARDPDGHDTE